MRSLETMNDDEMFSLDPWEILQEHELMINKLIRAHNEYQITLTELTKQNLSLSKLCQSLTRKVQHLEHEIKRTTENNSK